MSLTALKRQTADRQVADALRDHIVRGELAPGTRLTEEALAEQFAISRGSVRTALQALSQEGLIEQTPYIGWAVATLSATDVWELCTLRASLEGLAARLASERLIDEGRARLSSSYDALVVAAGSNDARGIAQADFELHKTIVALSGHGRLVRQYALVEQQVRMYIASSDAISRDPARIVIAHHGPIVAAILAGQGRTAARLSEQHNHSEGRKLADHLRSEQARQLRCAPETPLPRRRGRPPKQSC